ncbi:MAG: 60S ribosomal protein L31 [Amphiamblys sp. WSBS2006]|nr:MAG: 60S ribosomal protein L31 [Amphiamblys sp. WSBS2006]
MQEDREETMLLDTVTKDFTMRLGQKVVGKGRKRRATRAIKAVRKFVQREMKTTLVRIDTELNKKIWEKGQKEVPKRIRIRVSRKRNPDEDAQERLYSHVLWIPVASFKNLETETVED